jgi:GTPase SAR1 family protein
MRDIKTRAPPDCDIVLCGNKADLESDRVVSSDEGRGLAEEYGVQFFETSALTGANVETMFTSLATTIKRRRIDEFENKGGAGSPTNAGGGGSVGGESRTVTLGGESAAAGAGPARSCC